MSAGHIAFDDDDTRSLHSSAGWMIAAAVVNLLLGVVSFDTDAVSMVVGRALGSLQVALLVRTIWVSLLALWFLAAPFLFGGMAVMMALRW